MKMQIERTPDHLTRIELEGRLDLEGTQAIDQQFGFATATQPLRLAVDLAGVSYVASIGLRTLLTAARAQASRGGRMVLVGPSDMVRRVLVTTGVDTLIPICTDWASAGERLLAD